MKHASYDDHKGEKGFTLLLAALVASIVLTLGMGIFQIAFKQVNLSAVGRDSQFAFYAADTGAECALYWDVRFDYFGVNPPAGNAFCGGGANPLVVSGHSSNFPRTMTFEFETNGRCTEVTVVKSKKNPSDTTCSAASAVLNGVECTIIHADGYSTNCLSRGTNERTLQRSVEIYY